MSRELTTVATILETDTEAIDGLHRAIACEEAIIAHSQALIERYREELETLR